MIHRIELFSKYLEIDKDKLIKYAYSQAVLDAIHCMQDGQSDPEIALYEATQLEPEALILCS